MTRILTAKEWKTLAVVLTLLLVGYAVKLNRAQAPVEPPTAGQNE